MSVLKDIAPERVFYYFEQISQIPRGSGNCRGISDYLKEFGTSRGLDTIQDRAQNIIIKKPATAGYEDQPTIILQGHMDMVAVATPESGIDMKTTPLQLRVDGDYLSAENTSLGGDDGIAVAYSLALLESDSIPHPALEVVITTEEEVGMDGARAIDLSSLKGHRLLNLDSEDEGIFLTGCAGGARVTCLLPLTPVNGTLPNAALKITVDGLLGGHSGGEIHRGRANSNVCAGEILTILSENIPGTCLSNAQGGLADNAIPRKTELTVLLPAEKLQAAKDLVAAYEADCKQIYATKDPGLFITCEEIAAPASAGYAAALPARFLNSLPNGVQAMSADVEGLVETSLNLGILKMTELEGKPALHAEFSVRSSCDPAKDILIRKLESVTALAGGVTRTTGTYPGWKYRVDSPLRDKMVRVFEELYGKTPKVEAIHAGLECGLFSTKIDDLDCVSIGPDMCDIHTTEERLSISSCKRTWEYLLAVLADRE